jgi:hypothetical protein
MRGTAWPCLEGIFLCFARVDRFLRLTMRLIFLCIKHGWEAHPKPVIMIHDIVQIALTHLELLISLARNKGLVPWSLFRRVHELGVELAVCLAVGALVHGRAVVLSLVGVVEPARLSVRQSLLVYDGRPAYLYFSLYDMAAISMKWAAADLLTPRSRRGGIACTLVQFPVKMKVGRGSDGGSSAQAATAWFAAA